MPTTTSLNAFVVDDEPVIAATLAAILNVSGLTATAFTNPALALNAAEQTCPDILISDVMMPEMSGIDLAIQIKALSSTCRVLLFSGQAATADLLATANGDGHEFQLLAKPIHPVELLAAIGVAPLQRLRKG